MKSIIGAIALTLAVPAFAQAAPPADPQSCHAQPQAAPMHEHAQLNMDKMHEQCRDMMKHHAKMESKSKRETAELDEDFNGNGHQGHRH